MPSRSHFQRGLLALLSPGDKLPKNQRMLIICGNYESEGRLGRESKPAPPRACAALWREIHTVLTEML